MTYLSLLTAVAAVAVLQGAQPDLQSVADRMVEASGAPGGAVALQCGDRFDEAASGVRKLGEEVAAAPGDHWHLGSVTKPVTATLAARLVEAGVIDWDTTLGEALAGLDLEPHPDLAAATLEDLLAHRGGVKPNAGALTMVRLAGTDAERDALADRLVYARAVTGEPGGPRGEYLYSNAGYVLAAMMMEAAADTPYEALMAREVFEPLGLDEAGWGPPGETGILDQPRGHAAGLLGLGAREPGAMADNPVAMNPAARLHMPLSDVLAFLVAHRDRPEGYLAGESWDRLHAPRGEESTALGWGVQGPGVLLTAGTNTMWFARVVIVPHTGCAAASVVNSGDIQAVAGPTNDALLAMLER